MLSFRFLLQQLRRNCAPPTPNCQSHPKFSLLTKPATRRNSRSVKSDSPNILPCAPLGRAFVAAASTSHHTATSFKRMGGRAAYCSGLENRQTLKSLVGSNPTLSATFCGSARIDVHPGASQPVMTGNDEAGLSAEMFRDKPHDLRAFGVCCTELAPQLRTRFNSANRPPSISSKRTSLPKPSWEAAARPKCAGNETGYKPHGGSSLAGVAESFAGSDGLQPVTLSKTQRQTGGYLGAAAKPDSSPAKISPKCCLPFIITNYCSHRWGKTTPNGKQVCKRCGTVKGFKTTNHCAA